MEKFLTRIGEITTSKLTRLLMHSFGLTLVSAVLYSGNFENVFMAVFWSGFLLIEILTIYQILGKNNKIMRVVNSSLMIVTVIIVPLPFLSLMKNDLHCQMASVAGIVFTFLFIHILDVD